jgi:hypothetical protein
MDGHLVTIKVSIEGWADQWMQLNRAAIDKLGLKRLDTETVQGGGTVKQNRMAFDYLLENLHNLIISTLNQLLCSLDIVYYILADEAMNHEGLEQLDRHFLGQTALMHLELGTNHNHGTA